MIRKLNHAVLWASGTGRAAAFYTDVLGFTVVASLSGRALFLRAPGSTNDHDLGLFEIGRTPAVLDDGGDDDGARDTASMRAGLYHLAWEVATIEELAELHARLAAAGALVGTSDHGVSKSVYGRDADGIEFEVM